MVSMPADNTQLCTPNVGKLTLISRGAQNGSVLWLGRVQDLAQYQVVGSVCTAMQQHGGKQRRNGRTG